MIKGFPSVQSIRVLTGKYIYRVQYASNYFTVIIDTRNYVGHLKTHLTSLELLEPGGQASNGMQEHYADIK